MMVNWYRVVSNYANSWKGHCFTYHLPKLGVTHRNPNLRCSDDLRFWWMCPPGDGTLRLALCVRAPVSESSLWRFNSYGSLEACRTIVVSSPPWRPKMKPRSLARCAYARKVPSLRRWLKAFAISLPSSGKIVKVGPPWWRLVHER